MVNLLQQHRERVGRQIKTARKEAGFTHDSLAAVIGSSRQHLIKLEKGQHAPRAEMLQKIADATGKAPAFFAEGDDDDEESEPMSLENALLEIARSQVLMSQILAEMRRERVA